jgi:type III pantothenate kinase
MGFDMLLLIDAGNTRIKWALAAADAGAAAGVAQMSAGWLQSGAVARADWAQLPGIWRAAGGAVRRVLVSNVAGAALRDQLLMSFAQLHTDAGTAPQIEWLVAQAQLGGVRNGYRQPAQLGCDRFASAIGAHALFPAEALVVATCGTATTIDAIGPDGHFIGGMILPGLGLMAASLALNTAQLPQVSAQVSEIAPSTALFADNTEQAIVSGCIAAQVGAIERAVRRHRQAHAGVRCILAGGAADYLTAHLEVPHERLDNLVLIGLNVLAKTYSTLC